MTVEGRKEPAWHVCEHGDCIDHRFEDLVIRTRIVANFELVDHIGRLHGAAIKAVSDEMAKIAQEKGGIEHKEN